MSINSNLFRARVGVYNFNMRSCKKEPNIHIELLSTMPLEKSFKISFLMLIVLFLLVVFLNFSFILIFKGASESMTVTNLTWSVYMFAIRYFINNFKQLLLLLSGDIETNPDPKRSSNIKFCHWNLNGLAAHDFIKVPLVEAFITSNNFDLVSPAKRRLAVFFSKNIHCDPRHQAMTVNLLETINYLILQEGFCDMFSDHFNFYSLFKALGFKFKTEIQVTIFYLLSPATVRGE